MSTRGLQTEFNFTLPLGYVDDSGTLHKTGAMRLAPETPRSSTAATLQAWVTLINVWWCIEI